MTFCGYCGTNNPDENLYCYLCGNKLVEGSVVKQMRASCDAQVAHIGPGQKEKIGEAPDSGVVHVYIPAPPEQSKAPEKPIEKNHVAKGMKSSNARYVGIILAIAALVLTAVTLFYVPLNLEGFGSTDNTLFDIGINDKAAGFAVMMFVIVALVLSIFALIVPMFSLASAVTIIVTVFVLYTKYNSIVPDFTFGSAMVFGALAVIILLLGAIATVQMCAYAKANRKGTSMFMSCLYAWIGLPKY